MNDLVLRDPRFAPLLRVELAQAAKFGPQGVVPPFTEYQDKIAASFVPDVPLPIESDQYALSAFKNAIARVISEYEELGMHREMFATTDVVTTISNSRGRTSYSSNSGLPDFIARNDIVALARAVSDVLSDATDYPAVILPRAYRGKLRFV